MYGHIKQVNYILMDHKGFVCMLLFFFGGEGVLQINLF